MKIFSDYPTTPEAEFVTLEPEQAFAWLLGRLKDYSRGKLIWTDVRQTFVTADAILRYWEELRNSNDSTEINRISQEPSCDMR